MECVSVRLDLVATSIFTSMNNIQLLVKSPFRQLYFFELGVNEADAALILERVVVLP
jgi:hypothetical protein